MDRRMSGMSCRVMRMTCGSDGCVVVVKDFYP
jgi:hypothetical protein